jgi:hypothetical protein
MGTVRSGFWTLNLQKKSFLSFFSYNFLQFLKPKRHQKKKKIVRKKKKDPKGKASFAFQGSFGMILM